MPAITAAVLGGVGTAVGLASAGMSFGQASKQRKAQQEAQQAAEKAMDEAKKALSVNYFKGLSIQKEPYELEREALAQAGAQAMEAARETERGVAPTAGRIQMAQNAGQRQIAGAMGQEMSALEKLTAEEESRLRDARAQIALEEAAGAQYTAGQAAKAQQEAMATGFAGLTNAMSTAAGMTDKLYATKKTPPTYGEVGTVPQTYSDNPNIAAAQKVTEVPQTLAPQLPSTAPVNQAWTSTTPAQSMPNPYQNIQYPAALPAPPFYLTPKYSGYSPFNRQGFGFVGNNFSSVTG